MNRVYRVLYLLIMIIYLSLSLYFSFGILTYFGDSLWGPTGNLLLIIIVLLLFVLFVINFALMVKSKDPKIVKKDFFIPIIYILFFIIMMSIAIGIRKDINIFTIFSINYYLKLLAIPLIIYNVQTLIIFKKIK